MTPAERELRNRYRTARKDCLHNAATLLRLLADERWAEVVRMAEVLGDRATEAGVMAGSIKDTRP